MRKTDITFAAIIILLAVAAITTGIIGVWTGDERWVHTARIALASAVLSAGAWGTYAMREDFK